MKRTSKQIRKHLLEALKDGREHSYSDLERKLNTNWKSIRDHCEDLLLFSAITISKDNKVKITKEGNMLLKKL